MVNNRKVVEDPSGNGFVVDSKVRMQVPRGEDGEFEVDQSWIPMGSGRSGYLLLDSSSSSWADLTSCNFKFVFNGIHVTGRIPRQRCLSLKPPPPLSIVFRGIVSVPKASAICPTWTSSAGNADVSVEVFSGIKKLCDSCCCLATMMASLQHRLYIPKDPSRSNWKLKLTSLKLSENSSWKR